MNHEELQKIMDRFSAQMGEYFDCLVILGSNSDADGTDMWSAGQGNWWGQLGMAQEFINRDARKDTAIEIASEIKHEE